MAEDRASGSAGESPSHSPDPRYNRSQERYNAQDEPGSPVYQHHQNGSSYQNGRVSEESREDDDSRDSHYDDTPLDFSIKRREQGGSNGAEEVRNGHYNIEPITPPPVDDEDRGQDRTYRFYKPGPAVFPHVNGLPSPQNVKSENCVSPRQCKVEKIEKIGEPQTAQPGMVPGMTLPISSAAAAAQAGLLPGFFSAAGMGSLPQASLLSALPFLQMDPRVAASLAGGQLLPQGAEASSNGTKNGTYQSAFKNYPKELLSSLGPLGGFGLHGLPPPLAPLDMASAQALSGTTNEDLFNNYKKLLQQQVLPPLPDNRAGSGVHDPRGSKERRVSGGSTPSYVSSTTPTGSEQGSPTARSTPTLNTTSPMIGPISPALTPSKPGSNKMPSSRLLSTASGRKRPKTIPDEAKDSAYWERRRKNNEAAKRSRDARRAKEDEIAIRAAFLEQENLKLRVEVAALKNETSKLRCMLYNSS